MPPVPVAPEVAGDRQRFGTRLRELRGKARLTQEDLAERASTDRKTISRVENGVTSPALDVVFALARALDVKPGELFRW